jgi:tRNA nucleotidyltransferase (CCA-adding enzyme)
LLKTLTPEPKLPGRLNLSDRLEEVLPAARLALLKKIADAALDQHAALYIVGGFVRDLLLERPILDFDLVVEGDAIALARSLARKHGGRITSHARFGTSKWHFDQSKGNLSKDLLETGLQAVDLVSARTEFYNYPTALPTVERGSIKLDLHRRDFTINTLALRLDGRHYGDLHDYWGGLQDLRNGLVRVLHSLSFVDDPTRILRAVRFEKRFSFEIGERTMQLLLEARPMIERLSGDRIRHELNHILDLPQASKILERAKELSLLDEIHEDLVWDDWLVKHIKDLNEIKPGEEWELEISDNKLSLRQILSYIIWLVRLKPENALGVIKRLKLSVTLRRAILSACELWQKRDILTQAAPSQFVEILDDAQPVARYALLLVCDKSQLQEKLHHYAQEWRFTKSVADGHALKELGLPPGPVYRDILRKLRAAWLDGQVKTPQAEQQLLNEIIDQL